VRIVAWNCGGGFHAKAGALASLAPDVAIIGECAEPAVVLGKAPGFRPSAALWAGEPGKKGLAAFAFGAYRLEPVGDVDRAATWALPARVAGPHRFNLLGVWANHGKRLPRIAEAGPGLAAIRACRALLADRAAIVAGDFNNHVRWDRPRKANNHAIAVAELAALGLVSAYHAFHGLGQGAERHPTLYWRDRAEGGPTYHIDYAFLPGSAVAHLADVSVGSFADWVATGLSDHVPLIVHLRAGFAT
jgi:exodeoxyribonuclease III